MPPLDSHPNMEIRVYNPMGTRGAGKGANMVYHKGSLDHRMHNKIFLVDSAVAVLGGRNIGDDYFGIDEKLNFRDLDVLAVGPAAKEAGEAFDMYWNSPAAVPIGVLLKEPVAADALEQRRTQLIATLDEMEALPYTIPLEEDEYPRELPAGCRRTDMGKIDDHHRLSRALPGRLRVGACGAHERDSRKIRTRDRG